MHIVGVACSEISLENSYRKLLLAKPTLVLLMLTKSDVAYVIINKHIGKMGKHVDAILAAKGGHTDF